MIEHIVWSRGLLRLLDQRLLPDKAEFADCRTPTEPASAIKNMVVRGAPAIGITAAYGMALAAFRAEGKSAGSRLADLLSAGEDLKRARPTAVNLAWAVDRMAVKAREAAGCAGDLASVLSAEAEAIHAEDIASCKAMGANGLPLMPEGGRVLTHCNAGALATGGYGTALGLVRAAREAGRIKMVYADETRPYLQGARLTAWELAEDNIPVTVLCDDMAASLMAKGQVDVVIVGADRIAANGDTANKIGTYGVAVLASHHRIPFLVAAPSSTFDMSLPSGEGIPIEERPADEVAVIAGRRMVPRGAAVLHPAFDVTPAPLITAIVTERGVISPVTGANVGRILRRPH